MSKNMLRKRFLGLTGFVCFLVMVGSAPVVTHAKGTTWQSGTGLTLDRPISYQFGGKIYQVIRGLDDKIHTRDCGSLANTCGDWIVDPSSHTSSAVAVAVFQGKVYMAARGTGDRIYTRFSTDGSTWSSWSVDLASQTPDAVTLVADRDTLYIMARGTGDRIYTRFSTDGSTWSSWFENGGFTLSPIAATVFNKRLYQGVRGLDNKIYLRLFDGYNWSAWSVDQNSYTPDAFELVTSRYYPNNLEFMDIIARGTGDKLYNKYFSLESGRWSAWRTIGEKHGDINQDKITSASAPSARRVIYPDDGLDKILVTVRHSNNKIYWIDL